MNGYKSNVRTIADDAVRQDVRGTSLGATKVAEAEPQIHQALMRLERAVVHSNEHSNAILRRFESVLRPDNTCAGRDNAEPDISALLSLEINKLAFSLEESNCRLESVIQRCELPRIN